MSLLEDLWFQVLLAIIGGIIALFFFQKERLGEKIDEMAKLYPKINSLVVLLEYVRVLIQTDSLDFSLKLDSEDKLKSSLALLDPLAKSFYDSHYVFFKHFNRKLSDFRSVVSNFIEYDLRQHDHLQLLSYRKEEELTTLDDTIRLGKRLLRYIDLKKSILIIFPDWLIVGLVGYLF